MRQQESEPLEEFSQRIYFMALDGFDKGNPEVVDQIATEAFLRLSITIYTIYILYMYVSSKTHNLSDGKASVLSFPW
jgi:hypothetical protein